MTRTVRPAEADLLPDAAMFASLERSRDTHLEKMDSLLDWERFRETLERAWPWTRHDPKPGRPSWDAVLMFKVLVVGKTKGDLSDESLEDLCRYHGLVARFLRLRPGAGPDAKTIHNYRKALAKRGVMGKVFEEMDRIARDKGFEMRDGCMIDASVVDPVQRLSKEERERIDKGGRPRWRRQSVARRIWTLDEERVEVVARLQAPCGGGREAQADPGELGDAGQRSRRAGGGGPARQGSEERSGVRRSRLRLEGAAQRHREPVPQRVHRLSRSPKEAGWHEGDAPGGQHVDRQDPGSDGACLRLDLQRHESSLASRRGAEASPLGTAPGARRVQHAASRPSGGDGSARM